MPVRSVQDQVSSLLTSSLVEPRTRGVMNPSVEGQAVFESVALNLLLNPRTSYYAALLARNGLLKAVNDELAAVATLRQTVQDLGNASFAVTDLSGLNQARVALVQLESLSKISTTSGAYKRFSGGVDSFLGAIAKNVKKPLSTSLIRPGVEAAQDLSTDLSSVKSFHSDMLDRLYALRVGVQNFVTAPFAQILGAVTASRVRSDLDDILASFGTDPAASAARDTVIRLIANRAAIKSTGSLPKLGLPVLDTATNQPPGYSVSGTSDAAPASAKSSIGPFTFPTGAVVTVNGNAKNFPPYPTGASLNNRAVLVGSHVTGGIVVPATTYLFITTTVSGVETAFKVLIPATTYVSVASLCSAIQTAAGSAGLTLAVYEWGASGSGRIAIASPAADAIRLDSMFTDGTGTVFTTSGYALIGMTIGQRSTSGSVPADLVVAAWNLLFSSAALATLNSDGSFSVASIVTDPTAQLVIVDPAMGLSGTFVPQVSSFSLSGKVNGVDTLTVSPIGLMDPTDKVITPGGTSSVSNLSATKVQLAQPVSAFSGAITVTSALQLAYEALEVLLAGFLKTWLASSYARDLQALDFAAAPLNGNSTPAQRNTVIRILDDLSAKLTPLVAVLTDPTTQITATAGSKEKASVQGILTTLAERKYDKAQDLFLRCKIQEMLSLSAEAASYGGALMTSMQSIARADIIFPNKGKDQGLTSRAVIPGSVV